ncbi:TonB-dependent siderophore receptor [Bradyrhizobium sp. CB82]|uniref:TonB-dependent siderophore receptor n=1 Tax=Bradyrhizobium sp. CB82 TaxID=3039159 RepID=UPI0024B0DC8F|nr:TonB-dependent siderophore receptor [Bradyrhizobium sp. CB82]WFU41654.1 TonB-dependent siderophore receptor [Bradyrhizobium sp. CB82]
MKVRAHADGQRVRGHRNPAGGSRARSLIGAAVLLADYSSATGTAGAQSALPPVTVEAPNTRPKQTSAAATSARRTQATARQRDRNPKPTEASPSERAAAAAAVLNEAKLGYRAMPSSSTLRTPASPLDTSQSVNVVPEQVLKDQLPRNLDDALANVSGITQTNTLAGTQDAIIRRGFGDNRDGSVMRNGMPLVQGRSLNAAVESVEVLKGPASLIYGIMDPGGIVNTISKRPELYQHGSITLLGSTYGWRSGGDALFDITGPIGKDGLAYRFIAYGLGEDYWRNFGTHKETLIAPSLAWYGKDTTIQLNYEHRDFLYPFDRGTAIDSRTMKPLAIPATRRLDEPYNNMWGTSDLVQASVEHRFNQDWKLYAGYSYNTESYGAYQLRITAVNPVTGIEARSNDGTLGALSNVSYGTSYLQGAFWLGEMRNEVLFGGDAQYRTIYRQDLLRKTLPNVFNVYNPIYGLVGPGTTVSPTDSDQTDKLGERALFFQDTLHLTDRFALVGGVRWMEYEQLAGKARPFVTNTNLSGDKALPLGGAILKLTDQVSLYASYTESLKPTSTIAPLTGGVVVGSNIAPEQGTQYETGVKFDLNRQLSGTVAVYDIDKRNVLVSQLNSTTRVTEYRAAGKVRSLGVEVDVTGRLTDHWSMIGSYGYTDARVTDDPTYYGKQLQNVALNTASLYLVYDFGATLPGRLRLGGGARYVGDRPGDSANTFVLPSYVVADVFATYETRYERLPVVYQLNVKNLFDTVYYPSAQNNLGVAIGDARRISLSATVKF